MSARFQTTHWSVVLQAGAGDAEASRGAMADLCEAYWFPVYGFVRSQGHNEEDARDLTQSYFATLLDKSFLSDLNPSLGRFRSFLLVSVRNFLSNERDRERTHKRGGQTTIVSFDAQEAETWLERERSADLSPERAFEVRWAHTIVRRSLQRLEQDFADAGQSDKFRLLRGSLVGGGASRSYEAIAAELQTNENAVKAMVRRLRKRFGVVLRAEVARTVDRRETIDDELRHLLRTLGDGPQGLDP